MDSNFFFFHLCSFVCEKHKSFVDTLSNAFIEKKKLTSFNFTHRGARFAKGLTCTCEEGC